jgi:hypothetical protein
MSGFKRSYPIPILGILVLFSWASPAFSQDIEPRRWTHLPTGVNVVGVGTSYSTGDIYFDPVLELEDVELELAGAGFAYLRTFSLAGKSARIDVLAPYANARWSGLLSGEPAKTRRAGFTDPKVRFSWLLFGAPALSRQEFATTPQSDTVVGVAVSVKIPWGEYDPEKLINLGDNRWVIRPQIGITHQRGKWTGELTGSLFWYEDNDEFFGGRRLENDELWAIQGHLIYTFRPGLWASLSTAYGNGGDTTVDSVDKNLKVDNWLLGLTVGVPINRQQGLKFSWIATRTRIDTGADLDGFNVGWTFLF